VAFNFDGNRPFQPLTIGHAYPLFEWALNWCIAIHAHQFVNLHAAVIERAGRVLIMPGPPGSGKSTLTAALVARGWRLFSDEMGLIDIEDRRFVPLPRPISLKNQSLDVIGRFAPGAVFNEVTHNTAKGTIAHMKTQADHVRRAGERAPGGWIVSPSYVAGAAATLRPQSKAKALMQLGRNAFNYNLQGARGFDIVGNLVDECACYEFEYGDLDEAVRCFDALAATASA
jgi:HprK-related kinase A